ncbi:MAG: hypothetical protein CSA74_08835 [Rhodobacterales bacterium]|nr:MAG: hypothetical protein CSA74_08835 [Rhodobacterales bacterium]
MVRRTTRTLLIATSITALVAGCDHVADTLESYGEAGAVPDRQHFGEPNYNNIGHHTGTLVLNFAKRFHETVPDTVTFAFNSAVLDENAKTVLRRQAHFIKQFPEVRFKVFGYADAVGSNGYNYRLGMRRAKTVVSFLVGQGISRKRLQAVVSYGETRPLINTQEPERQNRRAVTEVSGFVGSAPLILDGKYAQVIQREYVESATQQPEGTETTIAEGGGD